MSHLKRQKISELIDALEAIARRIRDLEVEAERALHAFDDVAAYRQKLGEKTWLLLELPESLEPLLTEIDARKAQNIRAQLQGFARRAEPALELASPFYMSALLYPDDYQQGAKNDLELFIEQLRHE